MSFRWEPFLWIHLAGIAVLPIFLGLTWLGLARAEGFLPPALTLGLLACVSILPIAWMQFARPFDIFSLLFVAVEPPNLAIEQRQILQQFKTTKHRILVAVVAAGMLGVLWQLYRWVPLAPTAIPLWPESSLLGLIVAGVAFAASNLFLQVPVSVLNVLLTGQSQLQATVPLTAEAIEREFSVLGFRVGRILPMVASDRAKL